MTTFTPSQIVLTVGTADTQGAANAKTNANMTAIAAQFVSDEAAIAALQQQIGQPADVATWSVTANYVVYSGNTHIWTGATVNSTLQVGQLQANSAGTTAGLFYAYQSSYPIFALSTYVYCFMAYTYSSYGNQYFSAPYIITVNSTTLAQTLNSPVSTLFTTNAGSIFYSVSGSSITGTSTSPIAVTRFSFSKSGVGYSFGEPTLNGYGQCQYTITWNAVTSTLSWTSQNLTFNSSVLDADDINDPVLSTSFIQNGYYQSYSINDTLIPAGSASYLGCATSFGNYNQWLAMSAGTAISTTFAMETFSAAQIVLANPGTIAPARIEYGSFPACRVQPAHECIGNGVFIGAYGGRQTGGSATVTPYVVAVTVSNTDIPQPNDFLYLTGFSLGKFGGVFAINSAVAMISWQDGAGTDHTAAVAFNPTTQRLNLQGVFMAGNYATTLISNYTQFDQYNGVTFNAPAGAGNSWIVMFHNFNASTGVLSSPTASNLAVAIGSSSSKSMTLLKVRRVLQNTVMVLFKQTVSGVVTVQSAIVTLA